jgi:hypothetical protein
MEAVVVYLIELFRHSSGDADKGREQIRIIGDPAKSI